MSISQIWQGHSSLPLYEEMKRWHWNWLKWRQDLESRQKIKSSFLPVFVSVVDQFPWLDKIAGTGILDHFNLFSRKSWTFWWRDRKFYNLCQTGLLSPALVRLFDTGKRKAWPDAREQIVKDNESVERQRQGRLENLKREGRKAD